MRGQRRPILSPSLRRALPFITLGLCWAGAAAGLISTRGHVHVGPAVLIGTLGVVTVAYVMTRYILEAVERRNLASREIAYAELEAQITIHSRRAVEEITARIAQYQNAVLLPALEQQRLAILQLAKNGVPTVYVSRPPAADQTANMEWMLAKDLSESTGGVYRQQ